ncbi:MAG TPA: bifunctional 4-hydroxy-2-oxoglutarate aldolase/2-dehydro-3-deoxy-phosphogluconate aldolase [Virgibacillus sp.]|nr:bifunctional 4-hydroxy-2-oxoglutarate aldolase/2-dehydro-3-deoxy-phosphogluconate aldolase [Virgibacillus sp.]HLR69351.1 bifunctional 4-hydroxy-2-oxoglutarate aldolase/2-dehydro-3-deoxy-phosphogluconate aldolase [Virgibacillus sp.]
MDKLMAIIRGVEPEHIIDVTQALLEGGVNWLEVSLSDEEKGLKCIQNIKQTFGDQVNLGAGTVINEKQVDASLAAGASFIITPGWDKELAKYILLKEVSIFPGVFSPGEIMQAASLGIKTVKLFPVVNTGTGFIKNIKGPFPDMDFMAVGGVNKKNIHDLVNAGCTYFAIGSDLVPRGATKQDKERIKESADIYRNLLKED